MKRTADSERLAARGARWRRATLCAFALAFASAGYAADVEELQARCEAAREARIKPLRQAEIDKCKAQERSDPAYCERYFADYGNAVRMSNGQMLPRLFHDLPECLEAEKARKAAIND
jgi:hypothetical protein